MGRGAVGFDLAEFDRGAAERERARAKDFVLHATALAASGHRWSELGYHPPRVHDYLNRFTTMVESCTPPADRSAARGVPGPDEAAMASCVRHRVLSALPLWDGCFLCNRPRYWPGSIPHKALHAHRLRALADHLRIRTTLGRRRDHRRHPRPSPPQVCLGNGKTPRAAAIVDSN
ncbi:hypothetical protein [Streptomyces phaeochromogenes]